MSDVAELGFEIDSSPLVAANDELERMPTVASGAKKATDSLNESFDSGASASAKFMAGIQKASDSIKDSLVDSLKSAVTGFVAFFAIENLKDKLEETAETIDTVSKAARAMGSSFASLDAVQVAGELAGVGADAITTAAQRMQKAIGLAINTGKGATGVFATLGITAQQLAAMPVDKRFEVIADKIQSAGYDASTTTAILSKLGDRTGALTDLMMKGGASIEEAAKDVVKFNLAVTQTQGENVEKMVDSFHELGFSIQGAFNQSLAVIAPFVTIIVTTLANGIAALVKNFSTVLPVVTELALVLGIAFGGQVIANIAAMAIGIGQDLVKAMLTFDAAADANPIGLIISAIGLLILIVYNFRDAIKQAIGVDVVTVFKDVGNWIIQEFEITYQQIVLVWKAFPSVMSSITADAVNFISGGINNMIADTIGGVNNLIGLIQKIPGVGNNIKPIDPNFLKIPTLTADGSAGIKALNDYNTAVTAIMKSDPLGALAKSFSSLGTAATDLPPKLNGASGATGDLSQDALKSKNSYDDLVQSVENKIAVSQNDVASLGQTAEQTEYLAEKQELLNKAVQDGLVLSPEQLKNLDALAHQEAATAANAAALTDIYNNSKTVFTGFFSSVANDIEQGKDLWTSLADAATTALDDILNKAIEMMANSAFDALWSGGGSASGGGLGGWISGLLGLGGGGASATAGLGMGDNGVIGGFAKGGTPNASGLGAYSNSIVSAPTLFKFASGAGIMGEAGAEAIMPLKRDRSGNLGVSVASNENAANNNNGPTIVQPIIYNNMSDQAQVTTGSDSQGNLIIQIDKIMSDLVQNPGSKSHKTMKTTFGLTKQAKSR